LGDPLGGRAYVVTGASRGIGRCLTELLIREGAVVHGVARSEGLLRGIAAEHPKSFTYTACDLTSESCVDRVVEDVLRVWGRPYGLVNNAGVGVLGNPLELGYGVFERLAKLLYLAPVKLSLAFGRLMAEAGEGVIVNVITLGVATHIKGMEAYLAPKHALHRFTKDLRDYLRPRGVRVVAVYPSVTATDFFRSGRLRDAYERVARNPIARAFICRPEDVASAIIKALKKGGEVVVVPPYLRPALVRL